MHVPIVWLMALAAVASARPQFNSFNQYKTYNQQSQQQRQYYQQQNYVIPPQQQQQQQQQHYSNQQYDFRQEAAASSTTPIPIISYINEINPDGSYHYSYETGNGIKADESGRINNPGAENEALAVQGVFSYIGDDGQTYSVQYTADENGFQPQGAHLPTAPPLPAELQKAIDEHLAALATAAPEEESAQSLAPASPHRHF